MRTPAGRVAVNDGRGTITSEHLAAARAAGLSDEEIAETVGHVALDFPAVAA